MLLAAAAQLQEGELLLAFLDDLYLVTRPEQAFSHALCRGAGWGRRKPRLRRFSECAGACAARDRRGWSCFVAGRPAQRRLVVPGTPIGRPDSSLRAACPGAAVALGDSKAAGSTVRVAALTHECPKLHISSAHCLHPLSRHMPRNTRQRRGAALAAYWAAWAGALPALQARQPNLADTAERGRSAAYKGAAHERRRSAARG